MAKSREVLISELPEEIREKVLEFQRVIEEYKEFNKEVKALKDEFQGDKQEIIEYFAKIQGDTVNAIVTIGGKFNLLIMRGKYIREMGLSEKTKYVFERCSNDYKDIMSDMKEEFKTVERMSVRSHRQAGIGDWFEKAKEKVKEIFLWATDKLWALVDFVTDSVEDILYEIGDVEDGFEYVDVLGIEELKTGSKKVAYVAEDLDLLTDTEVLKMDLGDIEDEGIKNLLMNYAKEYLVWGHDLRKSLERINEEKAELAKEIYESLGFQETVKMINDLDGAMVKIAAISKSMRVDEAAYLEAMLSELFEDMRKDVEEEIARFNEYVREIIQFNWEEDQPTQDDLSTISSNLEKFDSLWDSVKDLGGKAFKAFKALWMKVVDSSVLWFLGFSGTYKGRISQVMQEVDEIAQECEGRS